MPLIVADVRVCVIEPGAVDTELAQHNTDPVAKSAVEEFYAGMNNLQTEDIARTIAFVLSQPPHMGINEILVRSTDQT
ncbi:hypothetical protein ACIQWB_38350 [Streptomyces olivaceus]|uniref:hypothetical protein n=1 Tax=Streptomyces olivaceus TaxID=47716 RepID=UPI0037F6D304